MYFRCTDLLQGVFFKWIIQFKTKKVVGFFLGFVFFVFVWCLGWGWWRCYILPETAWSFHQTICSSNSTSVSAVRFFCFSDSKCKGTFWWPVLWRLFLFWFYILLFKALKGSTSSGKPFPSCSFCSLTWNIIFVNVRRNEAIALFPQTYCTKWSLCTLKNLMFS